MADGEEGQLMVIGALLLVIAFLALGAVPPPAPVPTQQGLAASTEDVAQGAAEAMDALVGASPYPPLSTYEDQVAESLQHVERLASTRGLTVRFDTAALQCNADSKYQVPMAVHAGGARVERIVVQGLAWC